MSEWKYLRKCGTTLSKVNLAYAEENERFAIARGIIAKSS
jgi:hypothetical protein